MPRKSGLNGIKENTGAFIEGDGEIIESAVDTQHCNLIAGERALSKNKYDKQ